MDSPTSKKDLVVEDLFFHKIKNKILVFLVSLLVIAIGVLFFYLIKINFDPTSFTNRVLNALTTITCLFVPLLSITVFVLPLNIMPRKPTVHIKSDIVMYAVDSILLLISIVLLNTVNSNMSDFNLNYYLLYFPVFVFMLIAIFITHLDYQKEPQSFMINIILYGSIRLILILDLIYILTNLYPILFDLLFAS